MRPNAIPIGFLGGADVNGFGLLEFVVLSTLLFLLVAVALTILILYRVIRTRHYGLKLYEIDAFISKT